MMGVALVTVISVAAVLFFMKFLVAIYKEAMGAPLRIVVRLAAPVDQPEVSTEDVSGGRKVCRSVALRNRSKGAVWISKWQGRSTLALRRPPGMILVWVTAGLVLSATSAKAQETVFNVPSGDVLSRGKVYFEFDATYMPRTATRSFTPRIVAGVGNQIEIGLNVNGLSAPGNPQATLIPTIKWKAYDGRENGWAFLIGDDVFLPVQNRTYRAGNYAYAEWTKTWRTKTRATFGAYDFTTSVVASGNRAGAQFAVEQPITGRFTLAADWYTGDQALGYVTPGLIIKATSKLTLYGTYQIGNHRVSAGNHQALVELGWNCR
jgi:hypothetical protein